MIDFVSIHYGCFRIFPKIPKPYQAANIVYNVNKEKLGFYADLEITCIFVFKFINVQLNY